MLSVANKPFMLSVGFPFSGKEEKEERKKGNNPSE
jgi:hypothetical protein